MSPFGWQATSKKSLKRRSSTSSIKYPSGARSASRTNPTCTNCLGGGGISEEFKSTPCSSAWTAGHSSSDSPLLLFSICRTACRTLAFYVIRKTSNKSTWANFNSKDLIILVCAQKITLRKNRIAQNLRRMTKNSPPSISDLLQEILHHSCSACFKFWGHLAKIRLA